MSDDGALTAIFGALADPTRRSILTILREGEATVGQLSSRFSLSQPAISRHLRVLADAGLIERRRVATSTMCSLAADPLEGAARWLLDYSEYWERSDDDASDFDPLLSDDGWMI